MPDQIGWVSHRAEDDGLPVVVHAPDGTVVAHVGTTKLAAVVLAALGDYYPEFVVRDA